MELSYWEIALRLLLAVLLGGLVGFERESHNRPAGFRTHILVCVGATLIMMLSAYGFTEMAGGKYEVDPSRIAAQVVTGIGFLGAGTIIQQRGNIKGLTTAASIWVVSGIGLAVGIGFYAGAVMATFVALISLLLLSRVDRVLFSQRRIKNLLIRAKDQPGLMGRVAGILGDFKLNIRKIELIDQDYEPAVGAEVISMEFFLVVPINLNSNQLLRRLSCLEGVLEISWQGEDIPLKSFSSDDDSQSD
jgi:putative Mg2+ transporter-C (MgtC) family protein